MFGADLLPDLAASGGAGLRFFRRYAGRSMVYMKRDLLATRHASSSHDDFRARYAA
jgi:hypothetical protein